MEYIEIPLYGKYGKGKVTLVDGDYDGEYFSQYRWYLLKNGYVGRAMVEYPAKDRIGYIYLHQEVQRPRKGMWVDHINRNKLDNRSSNLRLVTPRENALNSLRYDNRLSPEEEKERRREYNMQPHIKLRKREYDKLRYITRKSIV